MSYSSDDTESSDDNKESPDSETDPLPEWSLVCSTVKEWEELTESFRGSKNRDERALYDTLSVDFVSEIAQMIEAKVSCEKDILHASLTHMFVKVLCEGFRRRRQVLGYDTHPESLFYNIVLFSIIGNNYNLISNGSEF